MKLSNNFSLEELCKSQTAVRKGLNNIPDSSFESDIVENLRALCVNVLQPIRDNYKLPISPSSGYRSVLLNETIGGSKTSQHCRGEAVDLEIAGVPNAILAEWIQENLIYDQLILEFYKKDVPSSGWVLQVTLQHSLHTPRGAYQLILEFYKKDVPSSGWVHVSFTVDEKALFGNRKESLTFDGSRYTKGLNY